MRFSFSNLLLTVSLSFSLYGSNAEHEFYALKPSSIRQHFSFALRYQQSHPELAQRALNQGWELLQAPPIDLAELVNSPTFTPLLDIATKGSCTLPSFSDEAIELFQMLGKNLHNRQLKGHLATSEEELFALPPDQIDLARAVLLSQNAPLNQILSYEAILDFMALEILSSLPENPTQEELIIETNRLIFDEMRFRFPPHSKYSEAIDEYTFLGSVLDSRRGVCLGVSTLIFSLGQRLGIPFEAITPPGHIYLAAGEVNVETTARGIHLPTKRYLGINTLFLPKRNAKEMVGFAHFNQASLFWQQQDYPKAIEAYEKALQYAPEDPLILELLAYVKFASGERVAFVSSPAYLLGEDPLREDIAHNRIDAAGVQLLFRPADKRSEIEEKRSLIEKLIQRCPHSKGALFHLGIAHLQLGRPKEGVKVLERYSEKDASNPLVEYYLATLQMHRSNLPSARSHLHNLEELCAAKSHTPDALRQLKVAILLH